MYTSLPAAPGKDPRRSVSRPFVLRHNAHPSVARGTLRAAATSPVALHSIPRSSESVRTVAEVPAARPPWPCSRGQTAEQGLAGLPRFVARLISRAAAAQMVRVIMDDQR